MDEGRLEEEEAVDIGHVRGGAIRKGLPQMDFFHILDIFIALNACNRLFRSVFLG